MGLAAAYHALKAGHRVTVLEADKIPGGMAAHFDFGGLSIERYYHFVCKADQPTFDLMNELGIGDKMRWVGTSMGYYVDGRLHEWGNPVALLRFPKLSMVEKIRYGLMMFLSVRRGSPGSLETLPAKSWIEAWCGERVYARAVGSAVSPEVLRTRRQYIRRLDLDADQARRHVAPLFDAGGTRLYRRRHQDAGRRSGGRGQGGGRRHPPRRQGRAGDRSTAAR